MPELTPFERDLRQLEADLRKLESEYTMYFAGQIRRPPIETRNRVDAMIRRYDRSYIQGYVDRFRFTTLQTRYHKFVELWDRGMRVREEGRVIGGLAAQKRERAQPPPQPVSAPPPKPSEFSTTIADPTRDVERLKELHARLAQAGEAVGQATPPFTKFAQMVQAQVRKLQQAGASSVDFHVAIKSGKVAFSAKGLKEK